MPQDLPPNDILNALVSKQKSPPESEGSTRTKPGNAEIKAILRVLRSLPSQRNTIWLWIFTVQIPTINPTQGASKPLGGIT